MKEKEKMKMKENWFEDKRKRKYGVALGIRFSWDPDLEMYERFVVCSSGCNLKTALDSEMLSDIFYAWSKTAHIYIRSIIVFVKFLWPVQKWERYYCGAY